LDFDDSYEAEIDGNVSYPDGRRARWYAVDLPAFGELNLKFSSSTLDDNDGEVDLAFEVLNGDYQMITRADREEEDAGETLKTRTLYELPQGRYLIHVYAQEYTDTADFTLRAVFKPTEQDAESDFPARVAFVPTLPSVPPVDDAPTPKPRPTCGTPGAKPCRHRRAPKPKPETKTIKARISGITASARGTRLKINKGSAHGVAVGWRGFVITKSGKSIKGGSFRINKVSPRESYATVRAAPDVVTSAKYVRLIPR